MTNERIAPRVFSHIDTWVFDLDNTLYPHHVNLWQQVDVRIGDFVATYLKISAEERVVLQKDYYSRYGTTMRGMMTEHGVHADDYLAYVHEIDHSPLEPNPAMGAAIASLPGRKLILTNGSTDHAGKVLERLGIGEHFEAVFDIIAAELEPKPAPQTYDKFLKLPRCRSDARRDVRGSRAQPRGAARARHDHGAGGARRQQGSRARGLGAGRPRRRLCRSRHRRSDGVFAEASRRSSVPLQRERRHPRGGGDPVSRLADRHTRERSPSSRRRQQQDLDSASESRQASNITACPRNPDVPAALESTIDAAFEARDGVSATTKGEVRDAVDHALDLLDKGEARVAERAADGKWTVNQWLKKAVLLSFRLNDMSADSRRPRRRVVVGQGAVEVRRLGREPLPRRRLPRRARRDRAPLGLHRAERRADAVLRQSRRLCR